MKQYIEIHWTAGSIDEARRICRFLVQENLVACAQIIPWIESIYIWNDQVDSGQESKVILKTEESLWKSIEKMIQENSSYEVPEITWRPIAGGAKPYMEWMEEVLSGHSQEA